MDLHRRRHQQGDEAAVGLGHRRGGLAEGEARLPAAAPLAVEGRAGDGDLGLPIVRWRRAARTGKRGLGGVGEVVGDAAVGIGTGVAAGIDVDHDGSELRLSVEEGVADGFGDGVTLPRRHVFVHDDAQVGL